MLPRTCFQEHDAVLAFDYTDEEFYGSVETAWIHNWTGKFKFLTCAPATCAQSGMSSR